eukprot:gene13726-13848_t
MTAAIEVSVPDVTCRLEVVADPETLTQTVLKVLPVCTPAVQQQLIGFLPDIVQQQDHEMVIGQLQELLDHDLTFMAAVLDCISNMQLPQHIQDEVLLSLLGQLPAVEVEDLPGLVRYLLTTAVKSNAEQVLTAVRSNLHFVSTADPRLAVPDRKQKGPAARVSRSPEVLLVKDMVTALQTNDAMVAAVLALEGTLTEPSAHRSFDLLVLLALHAKGGAAQKAVEGLLRKKLMEQQAGPSWISHSLQGHQASFRELWRPLLSLAEGWSRSRDAPLATAAAQLYVDLFVVFESSLEHQQVLQALHGHLGSGVMGEQDAALQALGELARSHKPLLAQYSSYLANVLDHLDAFTDGQLGRVFSMFAALTAKQPGQQATAGEGASSSAGSAAGGSRLEDELVITLNKAIAQASPAYKRIGVIGNLALLRQAAADYELVSNAADQSAARGLLDSWVTRADAMFAQCTSHPGVLAFMMDHWADMLEQTPAASSGAGVGGAMPVAMLEWLENKVQDLMEVLMPGYCTDVDSSEVQQRQQPPQPTMSIDDSNLPAQLWFNLDGAFSPVYMQILPLAASRDAARRSVLVWMPASLRLLAAVSRQSSGGKLTGIDALMGCPLALPDSTLFIDRWDGLAVSSKVTVLTSLLHAVSWLREVVSVFATGVSNEALLATEADTQSTVETLADAQNKLLMRVSQLRLLEALFGHLASSCPAAAQHLPDLSHPISVTAGCGPSAAGAAAAAQLLAGSTAASGGGSKTRDREPSIT